MKVHIEATSLCLYYELRKLFTSWDHTFDRTQYENKVQGGLVARVLDSLRLSSPEKRDRKFLRNYLQPHFKAIEQSQNHAMLFHPCYQIESEEVDKLYEVIELKKAKDPYFRKAVDFLKESVYGPMSRKGLDPYQPGLQKLLKIERLGGLQAIKRVMGFKDV